MAYDKQKRNATQRKYHDKAYYKTLITLHRTTDAEIIDFIAKQRELGVSPTQLFKEWYKEMVK